ncbi:hypothetical protein [Candidatus Palauibacter sp.]|uniref:hypothetical protein n=1 Tax=Candidatus Palauibacter sp. TaxID=3101350 RepID=UPI003AF2F57A
MEVRSRVEARHRDPVPFPQTVLRTRATDETGLRQPAGAIFNAKGYRLNLVLPHPVAVE